MTVTLSAVYAAIADSHRARAAELRRRASAWGHAHDDMEQAREHEQAAELYAEMSADAR